MEGRTCLDLKLDHLAQKPTSQHNRETTFTRLGLPLPFRSMFYPRCLDSKDRRPVSGRSFELFSLRLFTLSEREGDSHSIACQEQLHPELHVS